MVGGQWTAYTGSYNTKAHDGWITTVMATFGGRGGSSTKNNKILDQALLDESPK